MKIMYLGFGFVAVGFIFLAIPFISISSTVLWAIISSLSKITGTMFFMVYIRQKTNSDKNSTI